jgi:hypothetical protein
MNQHLMAPHSGSAGTTRPTHAEIAKRAYEIYVKNGRRQGQCERNWLQAEQDLRKQGMAASQSKPSGDRPAVAHSYSSGSR